MRGKAVRWGAAALAIAAADHPEIFVALLCGWATELQHTHPRDAGRAACANCRRCCRRSPAGHEASGDVAGENGLRSLQRSEDSQMLSTHVPPASTSTHTAAHECGTKSGCVHAHTRSRRRQRERTSEVLWLRRIAAAARVRGLSASKSSSPDSSPCWAPLVEGAAPLLRGEGDSPAMIADVTFKRARVTAAVDGLEARVGSAASCLQVWALYKAWQHVNRLSWSVCAQDGCRSAGQSA